MSKKYAYLRVSASDQTLDRQRSIFKSHNIEVDEWFEEKASGKDTKRTELQRMLKTVNAGDTLYVTSIDRLSRSIVDFHQLVKTLHEEKKVNINILEYKIEITEGERINPFKKMFLGTLATFAEFERSVIEERRLQSRDKYLAAMAKAKAEGKFKGTTKPKISPQQIREIEVMLKAKISLRNIAKLTGVAYLTAFNYSKKFKQSCTEQHSQPSQHEEALK